MDTKLEQKYLEIGQQVAKDCGWKRDDILTVAFQALTDANYHEEAATILGMID